MESNLGERSREFLGGGEGKCHEEAVQLACDTQNLYGWKLMGGHLQKKKKIDFLIYLILLRGDLTLLLEIMDMKQCSDGHIKNKVNF